MYSAKDLFYKHQEHKQHSNKTNLPNATGYPCEHYHHDMVISVLISILEELENLNTTKQIVK